MTKHTDETRYTIALSGDLLIATAPDGDDAALAQQIEDSLSQFNAEDRDSARGDIKTHSGLVLYRSQEDATDDEEAGRVRIIYSGTDCGWLQDADGKADYEAAAMPTQTA